MIRSLSLSFAVLLAACAPQQPTPDVAARPSETETREVAPAPPRGPNPVDLSLHRPLRAWIDSGVFAARGLLVRQDLSRRRSTIAGYTIRNDRVTVLSKIELRRVLRVELEGIDGAVTLCAAPKEADAAPCI